MVSMPARADGCMQFETRTVEAALSFEKEIPDELIMIADQADGDNADGDNADGDDADGDDAGNTDKDDAANPFRRRRLSEVLSNAAAEQHDNQARDNAREGIAPTRLCVRMLKANVGRVKSISTYVP